jgi:exopolysaccharide biosynthesis WecB/TagA/CpsF family protein
MTPRNDFGLVTSDQFARGLADLHRRRTSVTTVTWLNHWSAGQVLSDSGAHAATTRMSYVGIDGIGLRGLLGWRPPRSSADTVIPRLLSLLQDARVAIVGANPERHAAAVEAVAALLGGNSRIAATADGYSALPANDQLASWVHTNTPTLVLVGLGAGKQEIFAAAVGEHMTFGLVLTCGGFLDQVTNPRYYPSWAYPLKLNWLVRLSREPKRLWRRYTIGAGKALVSTRRLRREIGALPGYRAYVGYFERDAESS